MVKAIILAAGRGKRISACVNEKPKPLIPIFRKPLIEYPLEVLRENGIKDCIIVVGYKAEKIREHLGSGDKYGLKIQYAFNPNYDNGNGVSLYSAKDFLKKSEPFIVLMADHIIDSEIVKRALDYIEKAPLICVDYSPKYSPQTKDATKVLVTEEGFVSNIGKELTKWNAIDTGAFILNNEIFEAFEKIREKAPATLSSCLRQMISDGVSLWACDVSGLFWLDIDFPEDLEFAEKILAEMKALA